MSSTAVPAPVVQPLASLDDRYVVTGRVYLTAYQALVRLLLIQRERDAAAGLNTAGFVSGYRGSPLGGLDQTLWRARKHLQSHHIVFQPGVNEDLAATAIWGTQQVGLFPGAKYDGVFAMWYGKGPGVDRCGDVFRHANVAGTARHGGVLAIAGDDHMCRSSTIASQTDQDFVAMMMPILAPAGVQEYLDYGVHGYAMSRFSGCWVAFKAVADTVETSASVDVDPFRIDTRIPENFPLPPDGVHIRWPDPALAQEQRLLKVKLAAAQAYCRLNGLDRIEIDSPQPRLGIITTGKAYLDVRQALDELGIDEARAAAMGIRLYKVGMVWPLEPEGARRFAEGLEEILVVEEKRALVESQLKELLYPLDGRLPPPIYGKYDERGQELLPATGELTPTLVARVLAHRLLRLGPSAELEQRLAWLEGLERPVALQNIPLDRVPTFCPGCPHNTSTRVPEGSRALAGIGCHAMAMWLPDRRTVTFTHMGGEGVPWVGQAPFTEERHLFANMGDGTYFHSGILAIRQAVAAGVNITYKILFNDAVAMTGGQPVDGPLTVPMLVKQLQAEGVANVVVVTDGTPRPYGPADLRHVPIRHRDELDAIQRELRQLPGVSAIVYDQTCAAEKRRRRKRGLYPDPPKRVFIHEAVCEGCGDCTVQSNCVAVVPVETEFGRKRRIDQSNCNKDYSCLKGFCPSFVTIEGGRPRKGKALADEPGRFPLPPEPTLPTLASPWNLLVTGVGGTGVITIGALIGMAAHLDGKGVTVLDMTGLAQKNGSVFSHIRIAATPQDLHAVRIAAGAADAIIGGDLIVTASAEALTKMAPGRTRVVTNAAEIPTIDFLRNPDWAFPEQEMQARIREAVGDAPAEFLDATALATRLMGDAIATNLFLLGYAWQKGWVPVSHDSLMRAIELNGVAVDMNRAAFLWGRRMAHDPQAVRDFARPDAETEPRLARTLDEVIARRTAYLTDYQDEAYAERYRRLVERVREAERRLRGAPVEETPGTMPLTDAVARSYFKLLAIKDEYEVARLYCDPTFWQKLQDRFEGPFEVRFHLAPPLLARPDPVTGRIAKREYGPAMRHAFALLAKMKRLRGTALDPFARTEERRWERALIAEFEGDVDRVLRELTAERLALATELLALPQRIRGYGHVKKAQGEEAARRRAMLWSRWQETGKAGATKSSAAGHPMPA